MVFHARPSLLIICHFMTYKRVGSVRGRLLNDKRLGKSVRKNIPNLFRKLLAGTD